MEQEKAFQTTDDRPVDRPMLDRRSFLQHIGAGIIILFAAEPFEGLAQGGGYPADFNAYLRIGEDGRISILSGKVELGQGVMTSLAQMAADELGVSLESIDMIMGDTDQCVPDGGTYGSLSVRVFGPALRSAAAAARTVLLDLAAEQLQVPKDTLGIENGVIRQVPKGSARITFAELAKGKKIVRKLEGKIVLKDVSQFKIMGQSPQRLDARAKVAGKAQYAGDIRLAGMLYARILRPPAHGARVGKADTTAAAAVPGVTVVNQDGLVAVLHADPEMAEKALAMIQAEVEFDNVRPAVDQETIFEHLVASAPAAVERGRKGDLAEGEKMAARLLERKYFNAYVAHASMETHTALAKVEGDKATLWVATQTPFPNQQEVARALGFSPQNVRVITPLVGGGFGGKSSGGQHAVEAARLAKITGKPVQVAWSRAEEFFYDAFRPAAMVHIKSGIDKNGRICLWDYRNYAGGSRGSDQYYDVPHNLLRIYGEWMSRDNSKLHPFSVGPWRAPAANTNTFARESHIDIMAAQAKIDPLEFRLHNTQDPRMRRVLEAAAGGFGWQKAVGPSRRGWGIACGFDAGTYVAAIAEVQVERTSGKVQVRRVVCAQDMGVVINPMGATMQMEGCVMMGLGYALSEGIRFKGGEILDRNFDTYELPRFSWLPKIETILVKNDQLAPQGGGEPVIILMGGLIANAIFDATGARLYHLPMTPARIKQALTDKEVPRI